MGDPLVSVCVPTYNRAGLLRQSLRTICAQEYSRLEILISDNSSEDETEAVCREFWRADSRIRYKRQSRNIGMHANHNFCIEESHGEFLCFFHDDDLYQPQIISQSVAFLEEHPSVGVVCPDWALINEGGEVIGARDHKVAPISPGLEYIERTMRSGRSSIGCPGAMVRRSALRDFRFDEQGPNGFGDFVVWFQMAERHAIGHINQRLWSYRLHRNALSQRSIESISHDYRNTLMQYCDAHLKRWPAHVRMVRRWKNYIDRFLFWALAYEVGLYFRKMQTMPATRSCHLTVFDVGDYRLTPEEFQRALGQLERHRIGVVQHTAFFGIQALIRLKLTWPLAWMTQYSSYLRWVLGLR